MPKLSFAGGIYHGVIEQARYDNGVMYARVWIPSWSTPTSRYVTSWAPIAIPWGTFNYGIWGSPHAGEHVWVAFEEGDRERPVVIGYNPMPQEGTTEMPPEFVNDNYANKAPATGIRDDPGNINPAFIVASPLYHQYLLLHDKLRKVVIRVADTPVLGPPSPKPPQNWDAAIDAAVDQIGEDKAGPFLAEVLEKAFMEGIDKAVQMVLDKAVELGKDLIKQATGIDVDKAVKTLGDLIQAGKDIIASVQRGAFDKAIELGVGLIKDATGLDLGGIVTGLGDLLGKAVELMEDPAGALGAALEGAIEAVVGPIVGDIGETVGNICAVGVRLLEGALGQPLGTIQTVAELVAAGLEHFTPQEVATAVSAAVNSAVDGAMGVVRQAIGRGLEQAIKWALGELA